MKKFVFGILIFLFLVFFVSIVSAVSCGPAHGKTLSTKGVNSLADLCINESSHSFVSYNTTTQRYTWTCWGNNINIDFIDCWQGYSRPTCIDSDSKDH